MRWLLAVMLPGCLLRALIPIGFMPMVGPDHSVRLVICDGYAPSPMMTMPSMSMPMDSGMDMPDAATPGTSGGGLPAHQDHGGCPYGSSPALGALPSLAASIVTVRRMLPLALAAPQVSHFEAVTRAQSPRGPPIYIHA